MAPVITELCKYSEILEPLIVVTGQHRQMLDQVLKIFNLSPDYDLGIMEKNQSLTSILTKSLKGLEEVVVREKPDMILVQGDTSTTFAAGLIAYYHRVPLGHIEAGLRTFDKYQPFPEEVNRKMTTVLADLHFPPTEGAAKNLKEENVADKDMFLTGNTVIDALLDVAKRKYDLKKAGLNLPADKKIVLVTVHRRENFGQPLKNVLTALNRLAKEFAQEIEIVLPVHRNPNVKDPISKELTGIGNINLIEPLDYEPFVHLMKQAYIILTDSGGVQEEAPSLGKPVLVMREKTERPEAVAFGTVKLVGTDEELIYNEASQLLRDRAAYDKMSQATNPYGDGRAAERIAKAILFYFGLVDSKPEAFKIK